MEAQGSRKVYAAAASAHSGFCSTPAAASREALALATSESLDMDNHACHAWTAKGASSALSLSALS